MGDQPEVLLFPSICYFLLLLAHLNDRDLDRARHILESGEFIIICLTQQAQQVHTANRVCQRTMVVSSCRHSLATTRIHQASARHFWEPT